MIRFFQVSIFIHIICIFGCSNLNLNSPIHFNNKLLWQKSHLTWGVDYTNLDFNQTLFNKEIQMCFDAWTQAHVFTFSQTNYTDADIKISFTTLSSTGHAGFPWNADRGIIRLNGKNWGTGFCLVSNSIKDWLPHEIGHVLGLKHTLNENSVMREYGPYGYPTVRDLNQLRKIYASGFKVLTWKRYDP